MCNFCEEEETIKSNVDRVTLYFFNKTACIDIDYPLDAGGHANIDASFDFIFCPFCSKRLQEPGK